MTPSGVHLNKPLVAVIAGVAVLVVVGYQYSGYIVGTVRETSTNKEMSEKVNVKVVDGVEEGDWKIMVDGKPVTVHYRHVEPDVCSLDVLFLHGQAFTSKTWVDPKMKVQSLKALAKLGYSTFAIDLPGYGDSPRANVDPVHYLEEVIKTLKLNKPVIVSPSMSGGFALPYLFADPSKVSERCRGFVPVAPVGTGSYSKEQYKNLQVPTLFIRGTRDTGLGLRSKTDLEQLPNIEIKEYQDAGHAAYLDNPDGFNKDLDTFFKKLLENKEG